MKKTKFQIEKHYHKGETLEKKTNASTKEVYYRIKFTCKVSEGKYETLRTPYFTSPNKAVRSKRDYVVNARKGIYTNSKDNPTIKELLELTLMNLKEHYERSGKNDSTVQTTKQHFKTYIFDKELPYSKYANKKIKELTILDIQAIRNGIEDTFSTTRKKKTLEAVNASFNRVLKYAKNCKYVSSEFYNDARSFEVTKAVEQENKDAVRNFMTYKEFETFIDKYKTTAYDYFMNNQIKFVPNRKINISENYELIAEFRFLLYKAYFYVSFFTGVRKGEARGLKWIDLEGYELGSDSRDIIKTYKIRIDKQYTERGSQNTTLFKPKTKNSIRECECSPLLCSELFKLKSFLEKHELYNENEFIFNDFFATISKPLPKSNIDRVFKHFKGLTNIESGSKTLDSVKRHITLHGLRHSACSYLLDEGFTTNEVAKFLGHKSTKMVEEVYQHMYGIKDSSDETQAKLIRLYTKQSGLIT